MCAVDSLDLSPRTTGVRPDVGTLCFTHMYHKPEARSRQSFHFIEKKHSTDRAACPADNHTSRRALRLSVGEVGRPSIVRLAPRGRTRRRPGTSFFPRASRHTAQTATPAAAVTSQNSGSLTGNPHSAAPAVAVNTFAAVIESPRARSFSPPTPPRTRPPTSTGTEARPNGRRRPRAPSRRASRSIASQEHKRRASPRTRRV